MLALEVGLNVGEVLQMVEVGRGGDANDGTARGAAWNGRMQLWMDK